MVNNGMGSRCSSNCVRFERTGTPTSPASARKDGGAYLQIWADLLRKICGHPAVRPRRIREKHGTFHPPRDSGRRMVRLFLGLVRFHQWVPVTLERDGQ